MALSSYQSKKVTEIAAQPSRQRGHLKTLNDRMHEKQDVQRLHEAELRRAKQDQLFAKQSTLPHAPDKHAQLLRQADEYVEQCERDVADARAVVAEIIEQQKLGIARLRDNEATAKAVMAALDREDQYLIHRVNRFEANWQTNTRGN